MIKVDDRMDNEMGCRICITCQKEAYSARNDPKCGLCYTCQKEGSMVNATQRQIQPIQMPMQRQQFGMQQNMGLSVSSLTVFPTNNCNFACEYCFIYRYPRNFGSNMNMSFETAQRICNWLMVTSVIPNPKIHWFGGEPLVAYPLIKRVTEWAKEYYTGFPKQISWGMTTNVSLINDEVNEFLRKYNYQVLCSIDGLAKDHNRFRVYKDGSGTWDDTIAGLDRLLTWYDKNSLTVRWTIHPDTIDTIVDGTKFFLNKGIISIAHEFVYEVDWSTEAIERTERLFEELIPIMVDLYKRGMKVDFKPFRDGLRALSPTNRMSDRCGLGRGDLGVDVDGNFFSCHRFVDQFNFHLGSVYTGLDINKIQSIQWDMSKIVHENGDIGTCLSCPFRMGCNAGCLAVNYDTTGNIYKPPKVWCDLQLMKLRLALKLRKTLMDQGIWEQWNNANLGIQINRMRDKDVC